MDYNLKVKVQVLDQNSSYIYIYMCVCIYIYIVVAIIGSQQFNSLVVTTLGTSSSYKIVGKVVGNPKFETMNFLFKKGF